MMILGSRFNPRLVRSCHSMLMTNRSFLSEAFDLNAEWNERLKSTIFHKIDMEKYFIDIDKQYGKTGIVTSLDLDIFANGLLISKSQGVISKESTIDTRVEQMEEILRRFRASTEAIKLRPSTTHAIVRNFVQLDRCEHLLKLLENRLKFGLILDDFTNIFLLNKLIKSEKPREAAKVATLMMLQEENNVPLARELALHATYNYINLISSTDLKDQEWNPMPDAIEPEPEEEVKIRVEEVENPDFDDHFDLVKREHLLGKTLLKMAGLGIEASILRDSLELLGLTLWEKYDKVNKQLKEENREIAKECAEIIFKVVDMTENRELETQLKALKLTNTKSPIMSYLESNAKEAVAKHEKNYIDQQAKAYKTWNSNRENDLEIQHKESQLMDKKQFFQQEKLKLNEEEQRLFFFDNYEAMEREKHERYLKWKRTWRTYKTGINFPQRDPNVPIVSRRERLAAKAKAAAKK